MSRIRKRCCERRRAYPGDQRSRAAPAVSVVTWPGVKLYPHRLTRTAVAEEVQKCEWHLLREAPSGTKSRSTMLAPLLIHGTTAAERPE
jgi:hypothetical protein